MKLEGAAEENILTLLAWDEKNAAGAGLLLAPELFSTRVYRRIAEAIFGHLKQYSMPPQNHLYDLLEEVMRKGEEGILMRQTLDAMKELARQLQSEYVLSTLHHFVTKRRLLMALEQASDALQQDDVEGAQALLSGQDLGLAQDEPGIWMHDADGMLGFLDKHDADQFSSGISALDDRGVMPARKELWLFIAPPKRGKSWHLIEVGKMALMHGHRVLHVTLENSQKITAQRYVQALFAMSKDKVQSIRTPMFVKGSSGHTTIDFNNRIPEAVMLSPRHHLVNKLKTLRGKARFMIKEFPTSSLTIPKLNAYLDMLEKTELFVPDMLIIDYPDLMAIDSANLRIDTGRLFKELRGVGVKRNMAVVAATQGSKIAAMSKTTSATMVAEDYSKIGTADTVVTYSQTGAERRTGLARILVDASRNAEDKWIALITQSYVTGQFSIDSMFMNHHIESEAERVSGDDNERED